MIREGFSRHAVAQVEAVVNTEVDERDEVLLVDRVPEPQLGSDAVVKPVQDRERVAALGGGGEPEQLDRALLRLWIEAKTCSYRSGRAPPTHFSPNDGARSAWRKVARLWSRISCRWATNSSRDRSSRSLSPA